MSADMGYRKVYESKNCRVSCYLLIIQLFKLHLQIYVYIPGRTSVCNLIINRMLVRLYYVKSN